MSLLKILKSTPNKHNTAYFMYFQGSQAVTVKKGRNYIWLRSQTKLFAKSSCQSFYLTVTAAAAFSQWRHFSAL